MADPVPPGMVQLTEPPAPSVVPLTDPDSLIAGLASDAGKLIAGALVTHGLVAQGQMQLAIGVVVGLLSLGWSVWKKYQTTHYIAAASTLPVDASRAEIAAVASAPAVPPLLAAVAGMSDADKAKLAALLVPPAAK